MSTIDQTAADPTENLDQPFEEAVPEHTIALELSMRESEALRAWLLKPPNDGSTSLDDPIVSRVLTKLGSEIDAALATANVRRELANAGIAVDHLSDEQVRELARRVSDAARPGFRS